MGSVALPQPNVRTYIKAGFDPNSLESIEPYLKELLERPIESATALQQWLQDWSELETALNENTRWIYVRCTVDTTDEKSKAALMHQYQQIAPHLAPYDNAIKKKFIASPFIEALDQTLYGTTIRKFRKEIELFKEVNIPLMSQMNVLQSKFDEISGAQSITYNGQEMTLQQASVLLKGNNREQRKEVYDAISARRLKDAEALDKLLTELIQLRHQIAVNAGYENYLQYRFDELGRFDYTIEDCNNFHKAVQQVTLPLINEFAAQKQALMGLDVMKPWDTDVDASGSEPLKPVNNTDDLVAKTIACFRHLDNYFAERIEIMREMKYLDLDSRMHKGPGGYNMTMPEIGVPFIFMNSANGEHDLITMVHEGGHAVHTFLSHPLGLYPFKEITSEIAEVASMGMELMSMEHWNEFYPNADDLNRARKNHLKYIVGLLAKTCLGDSFQHWMYTNPNHTVEERRAKWVELNKLYSAGGVDWSGYEEVLATSYQRILHFYVVPLYYIEYAFAQLGAIALWRNFNNDRASAIAAYKQALSLGFTKPIPVFYETAGARFDFSAGYIAGLVGYLKQRLDAMS